MSESTITKEQREQMRRCMALSGRCDQCEFCDDSDIPACCKNTLIGIIDVLDALEAAEAKLEAVTEERDQFKADYEAVDHGAGVRDVILKMVRKERDEAVADRDCLTEKLAVYGCPEELVIGYECDTPEGALHRNKDCWLKFAAAQRKAGAE